MASETTPNRAARTPSFRAVQLLPAPMTIVALAIAAGHHLGSAPLGVIAVVGALATVGSTLVPALDARRLDVA